MTKAKTKKNIIKRPKKTNTVTKALTSTFKSHHQRAVLETWVIFYHNGIVNGFLEEPLWSFEGITTAITNCLSSKFCSVNGDRNVQLICCNENIFLWHPSFQVKILPPHFLTCVTVLIILLPLETQFRTAGSLIPSGQFLRTF